LTNTFSGFEAYIKDSAKGYSSDDIYYYAGDDFQFFLETRY